MAEKVTPYKDSKLEKKAQVEQMFDNISGNYDGLNRVISFGIDIRWRKRVVKRVLATQPQSLLDIATGTGDLALSFAQSGVENVVGLDLSDGMLSVARQKAKDRGLDNKVRFVQGDSEALPFGESHFDAITVAFGVRNFETLEKGLAEIHRVLKPGGIFVVLETAVPTKIPFRQGYRFYTQRLMPLIGKIFSKDKSAYTYLSKSAAVFPHGEAFNNILRKIGFIDVADRPQTFGVASIYTASKAN